MANNEHKEKIPPGWTYNPSTWGERLPIVALGAFGFLVAGYMSLYPGVSPHDS